MTRSQRVAEEVASKKIVVGDRVMKLIHRWVVGGKIINNHLGDISLDKDLVLVEVKGAGSTAPNGFRLDPRQIRNNQERIGDYCASCWYVLVAYQNKQRVDSRGKRRTALSRYRRPDKIRRFVGRNILWVAVVDLSIVEKWREKLGVSLVAQMGRAKGYPTVVVKVSRVHSLTNGGFKQELQELELDQREYHKLVGRAKIGSLSNVPVVAVVRDYQSEVVQNIFNKKKISFYKEG